MPGFPAPFIKFRALDANANPLAGGKLYSYAAGTSTPLATYTTQALDVPNANPAIMDALGYASIYVKDGVGYKFIMHDALGNQQWTEDNVQVPAVEPAALPAEVPPGGIVMFGGTTAPTGWLLCDGASVSTSTYSRLFQAILYTFGGGGPTFQVPDLRQRFPLGKAVAGTGSTLGEKGGTIDHVHSAGAHTHTIPSHLHAMPTHTHTVSRTWPQFVPIVLETVKNMVLVSGGGGGGGCVPSADQLSLANTPADTYAVTLTTDSAGAVSTTTANPAFIALNFLIKT